MNGKIRGGSRNFTSSKLEIFATNHSQLSHASDASKDSMFSLFHMRITASVTKSSHQDCGPCYLHLPIFFLYTHSPVLLQNKKFLCRPSQVACMAMTINITYTQAMLHVHENLWTVLIPLYQNYLNLPICPGFFCFFFALCLDDFIMYYFL